MFSSPITLTTSAPSTVGGWHPDSQRAMRSIADNIASRTLNSQEYVCQPFFQRHAVLVVENDAVCLIFGFNLLSLLHLAVGDIYMCMCDMAHHREKQKPGSPSVLFSYGSVSCLAIHAIF